MSTKKLPALVTSALAATFLLLILVQDNLESYQFPLLLAIILCALSAAFLVTTFATGTTTGRSPGPAIDWPAIAPGAALGIAYYLCLEWLGFYTASYLVFLVVIILYDKGTPLSAKSVLIKALIAAVFIAALYGLFFHALHVQAPRGLFI